MARVGQELVAPVEVQAQPLERLGDDSFDVDGEAAATAMEQYRKSFERQEGGLGRSLISSGVQTK